MKHQTLRAVRGVVDCDAKGTTSRGTVFYLEVTVDGVTTRYEWGLLEELNGGFKPDEVLKPYREAVKKHAEQQAEEDAAAKKAKLAERESEIKVDQQLIDFVDQVISQEQKAVEEVRSGKEKALNSLVGKVIGQVKKAGGSPDAFAISKVLKQRITQ